MAITIIFMIFFRVFRAWISRLLKSVQNRQLKTSDYSVFVTGLPKETRGTDLGMHFQAHYGEFSPSSSSSRRICTLLISMVLIF